jgi:hypothetical protein
MRSLNASDGASGGGSLVHIVVKLLDVCRRAPLHEELSVLEDVRWWTCCGPFCRFGRFRKSVYDFKVGDAVVVLLGGKPPIPPRKRDALVPITGGVITGGVQGASGPLGRRFRFRGGLKPKP